MPLPVRTLSPALRLLIKALSCFLARALWANDDEIHHYAHDRDHADELEHFALRIGLSARLRGGRHGEQSKQTVYGHSFQIRAAKSTEGRLFSKKEFGKFPCPKGAVSCRKTEFPPLVDPSRRGGDAGESIG